MPPDNQPLVGIFVPVFNGERYLTATLDSLLTQTYANIAITIVDDGSTDGTAAIAAAAAARDRRVQVVRHQENRGLSAARNTGWHSISPAAAFVMNHDSDDISLPTKVETLVQYLDEHPRIDAVGSLCQYIDASGKVIGWVPIEWRSHCISATFGLLNSMVISATLVRRALYEAVAPFQPEFGGCDDYDFWVRAMATGFELANVPQVLHYVRIHPASMGSRSREAMRSSARLIAARYRAWHETTPDRKFWAWLCSRTARYRVAAMRLLKS